MPIVDFMHECKLGTWKALFTHLLRLLYAPPCSSELVMALDNSNGVIHKFSNNTSEMKRLAAHDFENMLQLSISAPLIDLYCQCTIPVFDGLFPVGHDVLVQSLLYRFAEWHALAKLRMHSDSTIKSIGLRMKRFNLATYKFYAMGDYVRTIQFFGTTDSFTTQIIIKSCQGELAHQALKAFYPLTSKLNTLAQLAKHEHSCCILQQVAEFGDTQSSSSQLVANALPLVSYEKHHHIATTQNNPINIFAFLRENDNNPALKNFVSKLRDHIIYRLQELDTMQVHYTTYDMRHKYDMINPRTHGDVMVLSGETTPTHSYWYAWVFGIYHMEVWLSNGTQPVKQHLEVLWVRWLAAIQGYRSGTKNACLLKVGFVEESDQDAFGFLDPRQVIRGCGVSSLHYGKLLAHPEGQLDDWEEYFVGM
ncbi:hypothetical protein BDR04DRAFT_1125654 [Suillus decipiens]|nr:hypothetical protein BDR04DRAFT_1125654 [Suillus decipiens]